MVDTAKNPHNVIDEKWYKGRNFSPVLEFEVTKGSGPIQADIGHNGVACIKFVAPEHGVNLSVAPYPTDPVTPGGPPANNSQHRIVSINKNKADFSSGARYSYDASIQGETNAKPGPLQANVPLVAGETYYANVANSNPESLAGGNCRIQMSLW